MQHFKSKIPPRGEVVPLLLVSTTDGVLVIQDRQSEN